MALLAGSTKFLTPAERFFHISQLCLTRALLLFPEALIFLLLATPFFHRASPFLLDALSFLHCSIAPVFGMIFRIMNTIPAASQTVSSTSMPALAPLLAAIGDPVRWRILSELSAGEPLMVVEIAERIGRDAGLVSKHLAVLRKAGLVVSGRARLYQIPLQFLPSPGQRVVDYGHCLLRLDTTP